jgi:ADP-ribose pyrophosphatase
MVSKEKKSVQIFPITHDNMILTVQQYRPALDKETLEFPGGHLNAGEEHNPIETALRELREETGYTAGEMIPLGELPYNCAVDGSKYLFAATDCKRVGEQDLDPNEFIITKKWELSDLRRALIEGKVIGLDIAYMALEKLGLIKMSSLY